MIVRPATSDDLPAIAAITNYEILHGVAHFGGESEPLEIWQLRFEEDASHYPWFVAEDNGEILGYAKSGRWKPRAAYDLSTEIGVYIHRDHRGKGVGAALYRELFPALAAAGFKTVIAGMTMPNPASEALHRSMGMETVGTFPKVGFKFDRWLDVMYLSRRL